MALDNPYLLTDCSFGGLNPLRCCGSVDLSPNILVLRAGCLRKENGITVQEPTCAPWDRHGVGYALFISRPKSAYAIIGFHGQWSTPISSSSYNHGYYSSLIATLLQVKWKTWISLITTITNYIGNITILRKRSTSME